MKENKTQQTDNSVKAFLDSLLDEEKKKDSFELLKIIEAITGEKGKIWGKSIIGFGKYHYTYASGREGEFLRIGFSPRKQNLTVYIMTGFDNYQDVLTTLGPYKAGKSCLYIKSLKDIHIPSLKKLIKKSYKDIGKEYIQPKMKKIDLKKEFKELYSGKKSPSVVTVPEQKIISIEGKGDPGKSEEYMDAIQTLYPVAYSMKFISKLSYKKDYVVMPLEGLWWADDMSDFISGKRDNWKWKLFIVQPRFITKSIFNTAVKEVEKKKKPVAIKKIAFEKIKEGKSAQIVHVGPYSEEGPTVQKLHDFIESEGGKFTGNSQLHHEIYLGDPRKTAPEKLKTIIRQPFTKK